MSTNIGMTRTLKRLKMQLKALRTEHDALEVLISKFVYHVTDGKLSKPYDIAVLKAEYDDAHTTSVNECVAEETASIVAENAALKKTQVDQVLLVALLKEQLATARAGNVARNHNTAMAIAEEIEGEVITRRRIEGLKSDLAAAQGKSLLLKEELAAAQERIKKLRSSTESAQVLCLMLTNENRDPYIKDLAGRAFHEMQKAREDV